MILQCKMIIVYENLCNDGSFPAYFFIRGYETLQFITTSWNIALFKKLTFGQLANKFHSLYWTQKFITEFTTARHWSVSWDRLIQSTPSQPAFFKTHFNIILVSTPKSRKLPLPFRFSDHNLACISHFSHACYIRFP